MTTRKGPEWQTLQATPSHPEEGEIYAEASVLVFPSAVTLTADGAGSRTSGSS